MKTKHWILLVLLLAIGCKPQQIIKEHTVTVVDSTEVVSLTKQLQYKAVGIGILRADMNRIREENTRLQSELTTHIINYDTTAMVNPDGKYPIAQEVIQTAKHKLEKQLQENEVIIAEYKKEVDNLMLENSNLKHELQAVKESENKSDTKTPNRTPWYKGIIYTIVFILLGVGAVRFSYWVLK